MLAYWRVSPENLPSQNKKVVFQPSFFGRKLLNFGGETKFSGTKKTGIMNWGPLWGESNLMLQCHGPNRGISPEIIGALFLLVSYFMTPEQKFPVEQKDGQRLPKLHSCVGVFFFGGQRKGGVEKSILCNGWPPNFVTEIPNL